jgi:ABC-type branched-subunit amino acid transport system ATPase component/branched-subunit amino acid ABC-type transport system permease component
MEVLRFALLGLGIGALYALASQGLLVIYRGSGVLNFAQGAIGMVGAYLYWEMKVEHGLPTPIAWIIAIAACALIGAAAHLLIMRQLKRASPLARIVATLGMLIVIQSAAVLRYGARVTPLQSELPENPIHIAGINVSVDRFILLGIAIALTVGLHLFYARTRFGMATTAVAENQRAAASVGLSPDRIAALNWALGSALAAVAGILIAPIVSLQVAVMTNIVLAALAAALVAAFRSFPLALIGGLILGVLQTEADRYVHTPGASQSLPAIAIVLWMIIRGQALPLRDYFLQRLPSVGSGRIRPGLLVITGLATAFLINAVPAKWQDAFVTTFAIGIILLSVVVITGYAGQLSLGQFALAGFGALIAGRIVAVWGWPFPLALLGGVVATVPLGALFALPAVRSRGINLAIATLALGTAVELMIFNNFRFVGGFAGTEVGRPTLFGLKIDAIRTPGRYAIVCMVCFVLVGVVVANIRRGRSGRRLVAVRTNERAAAALGISVPGTKVYAFALSAGIAAVGGTVLAFRTDVIIYGNVFPNFNSILSVAYGFIGGIGYLFGPMNGSTLAPGSLGANISNSIFGGIGRWVPLIGGVLLILLVLQNQNGIAAEQIRMLPMIRQRGKTMLLSLIVGFTLFFVLKNALGVSTGQGWLLFIACVPVLVGLATKFLTTPVEPVLEAAIVKLKPLSPIVAARGSSLPTLPAAMDVRDRVPPRTLELENVTVQYGGVRAVDGVSFSVTPGTILGLIGPNGAGKTSVIDAVTGFTRASGSVRLDGKELMGLAAAKRARAGVSRSFQSLELFEDISVFDNLRAASDPRDKLSFVRDLVYPVSPPLPSSVVAAIREFGLEDDLDRKVQDLPYARRRLLAIARAIASQPSVLLLDEPAAGLGDVETAELAHLVRRLADDWGIAVLLIEHDMNFVMSVCDRIVVLDFGRQIAAGTREEVRNDPTVVAAYLGEHDDEGTVDLEPAPVAGAER